MPSKRASRWNPLNQPRTVTDRVAIWGVIPAAGQGTRLTSDVPKQYLALHGETMLQRSASTLLANPAVDGVVVVVAPSDTGFAQLPDELKQRVTTVTGGASRADSVAAGVQHVQEMVGPDTWALVHDAARPLLSARDLLNLISQVTQSSAAGGILAVRMQDTVKRAKAQRACIRETISRHDLWQAQTPQMFRAAELLNGLKNAQQAGINLTDEASAMEYMGAECLLVAALDANFKVTRDADLVLAKAMLMASAKS